MFFSEDKKSIEDNIIEILFTGSKKSVEIISILAGGDSKVTEQAIYKSIRKLLKSKIIIKYKDVLSLHEAWLVKISNSINKMDSKKSILPKTFHTLEEGEKITYNVNSAVEADFLWSHMFGVLVKKTKTGEPIYTYVPHDWFTLVNYKSEKWQIESARKYGHSYLSVIGHNNYLDRYSKKIISNIEGIRTNIFDEPLFSKQEYYLNIFGDIIIEIFFDKKISILIHAFFEKCKSFGNKEYLELKSILEKRSNVKLVVSRDFKKASRLKKKLGKEFV